MNLIRPVTSLDLDALFHLAEKVSPGMTTFPPDKEVLAQKIALSEQAFSTNNNSDSYLMVLENVPSGKILGTAGVYANIGTTTPFYSFAALTRTQHSYELNLQVPSQTLHLVNAYAGDTEVGTLILDPDLRGKGLGKLVSKSRYLLLAQFRERFGKRVMAELRGWSDENAISPFWENVGKFFFKGMSYQQADLLSATTNNQFIADLMPSHPIYVDLLSKKAKEVIGKPHDLGRMALKMLYQEGFRYENIVDIFDAGPTVHANIDEIQTVKNSVECTVGAIGKPIVSTKRCLVCNTSLSQFRVLETVVGFDANEDIVLTDTDAHHLLINSGDKVRIYNLESKS
jgi:arginine N-succinyltransferase